MLQVSLTITAHGQQTSVTVSNDDLQDHQGGLIFLDAMDKSWDDSIDSKPPGFKNLGDFCGTDFVCWMSAGLLQDLQAVLRISVLNWLIVAVCWICVSMSNNILKTHSFGNHSSNKTLIRTFDTKRSSKEAPPWQSKHVDFGVEIWRISLGCNRGL